MLASGYGYDLKITIVVLFCQFGIKSLPVDIVCLFFLGTLIIFFYYLLVISFSFCAFPCLFCFHFHCAWKFLISVCGKISHALG